MADLEKYMQNPVKMHILGELKVRGTAKYSELKPKNTENDLFNYHLQHLVDQGIVQKVDSLYSFTNYGIELTSIMTEDGLYFPKFRNQILYYLYNSKEDKLLYNKRIKSPWAGDIMTLSSKVWRGRTVLDTARERYEQKTGFVCDFKVLGTLRKIIFDKNEELLDDCFYHVVFTDKFKGNFVEQPEHEINMWVNFNEAENYEKSNRSCGEKTLEILQRIRDKDYSCFFFEEKIVTEQL
jgi:hypothetical protein